MSQQKEPVVSQKTTATGVLIDDDGVFAGDKMIITIAAVQGVMRKMDGDKGWTLSLTLGCCACPLRHVIILNYVVGDDDNSGDRFPLPPLLFVWPPAVLAGPTTTTTMVMVSDYCCSSREFHWRDLSAYLFFASSVLVRNVFLGKILGIGISVGIGIICLWVLSIFGKDFGPWWQGTARLAVTLKKKKVGAGVPQETKTKVWKRAMAVAPSFSRTAASLSFVSPSICIFFSGSAVCFFWPTRGQRLRGLNNSRPFWACCEYTRRGQGKMIFFLTAAKIQINLIGCWSFREAELLRPWFRDPVGFVLKCKSGDAATVR